MAVKPKLSVDIDFGEQARALEEKAKAPESPNRTLYPPTSNGRKIYTVKSENWNKNFRYSFVVTWVDDIKTGNVRKITPAVGWQEFLLPINPSAISVSVPFAISLIPTTRGILEEHNGVVFRNILISGTTGVTPNDMRTSGTKRTQTSTLNAIIAPTLSAANRTKTAFSSMVSSATGKRESVKAGVAESDQDDFGYAKLHLLLNYFVSYAEAKKEPRNSELRLIFVNRKDNTAYVVTPISFEHNKSNDNPHLYNYKIALKAWDLAETEFEEQLSPKFEFDAKNENYLTRALNTLSAARAVISGADSTIRSVTSVMDNIYSVVGDTLLVVKDSAGLANTIVDFPNMIKRKWNAIAKDFNKKISDISASLPFKTQQQQLNIQSSMSSLQGQANDLVNTSTPTNPSGIPTGALKDRDQQIQDTKNPFNTSKDMATNLDFLDEYPLSDFSLSDQENLSIENKISSIRKLTIADYDEKRLIIEAARDAYELSRITNGTPILNDYLVVIAFNDIISVIDAFSATKTSITDNLPDPFVVAKSNANNAGITIGDPKSCFPIPFPFNGTLEKLATMYLDSPDRWIDIVVLNNLKPPYVDETGFIQSFTTSGNMNLFTISDITNLFLGQEVFLSSSSQRDEKRKIIRINKLGPYNYLIEVDGEKDLSRFTVMQQAKLKAFLPNTVNSNKIIFIPLETSPNTNGPPETRDLPETVDLNKQQKMMGVDIALTDTFDLSVANYGDVTLSTGLANALQAIRLKLGVEIGQLERHLEYGSGINIGEKNTFTAQDLKQIVERAILEDPRFESVPDIIVQINGPVVILNITVRVANDGGTIPVQFTL